MSIRSKFTQSIMVSLIMLFTTTSCRRQNLEYEFTETVRIPIFVDWSKADIIPQNVTVLIYDQATGKLYNEHRFEHNNNEIQSYISLPIGKYTVVVFNELRDQIDYIRISGYENFSTLKAHIIPNDNPLYAITDFYTNEPGILAAKVITNFEITEDMMTRNCYYPTSKEKRKNILLKSNDPLNTLMGIIPERKVGLCTVNIHIDGLVSSKLPILVDLLNISGEYIFETDLNTKAVTHQAYLSNVTFDSQNKKNGIISGSFYSFGVIGNRESITYQPKDKPLRMIARFMLIDSKKTIKTYLIDVANDISFSKETDTSVAVHINKNIKEALPDIAAERTQGESGFDTKLIDWGVVHVPLINQ